MNNTNIALIRQSKSGEVIVAFDHGSNAGGINSVRFSHGGERLYCAGKDGVVHVDGVNTRMNRMIQQLRSSIRWT